MSSEFSSLSGAWSLELDEMPSSQPLEHSKLVTGWALGQDGSPALRDAGVESAQIAGVRWTSDEEGCLTLSQTSRGPSVDGETTLGKKLSELPRRDDLIEVYLKVAGGLSTASSPGDLRGVGS